MANKYAHLAKEARKKRNKGKRVKQWVRSCISKKRLSAGIADIIIEKERGKVTLYKYYCGACDVYHLTKKPQNN